MMTARSISRLSKKSLTEQAPSSIAITHMSNALGTIVPVKENLPHRAHERGIPVLVDGSSGRGSHAGRRAAILIATGTS